MKPFALFALFSSLLLAGCGLTGDDDDDATPAAETQSVDELETAIADDLEGLADALAAGNFERVYDDFLTTRCQSLVARADYLRALEANREQIETQRVQVDDVVVIEVISAARVRARIDFTLVEDGEPIPRDPNQPPDVQEFLLEGGRWRSAECFGLEAPGTPES
ncbi:MAG: hypothetical protein WEB00_03885 [Dehalococcoidia bacterium]